MATIGTETTNTQAAAEAPQPGQQTVYYNRAPDDKLNGGWEGTSSSVIATISIVLVMILMVFFLSRYLKVRHRRQGHDEELGALRMASVRAPRPPYIAESDMPEEMLLQYEDSPFYEF